MSLYPKRLSELSPVQYESDDESDTNLRSKTEASEQPPKLLPKRLHELYLDSFESDDDNSCDKSVCATQLDHSSGFDESVDSGANPLVSSSTPLGKENDKNSCNRNEILRSPCRQPFSTQKLNEIQFKEHDVMSTKSTENRPGKKSVHFLSDLESTKVSMVPLEPRSLVFSPIEELRGPPKNHTNNVAQSADNFFATPSMKPPLTTGRIIFSSSQQKQRQYRKINSDYQKTLFTTPQPHPLVNHQPMSNTSDYATDSFNSFKKTPMVSILSPIDEEKISIDDFHALSASDDGTALTNKVIEINRKDYILKKKIGNGGSCFVQSIKCKSTGTECALKVVNLRTDACNVESYLNETKLLERLQGSDCVIKLFEYLHRPEKYTLFLVMELGENDLNKVLKSYQSDLPLNRIVSYWHQMLTAVKYIHDNGVIHSDLKPANFLLVNGRLKLIDFGIASNISLDATSIIKFSQTGTLNYISPEALIDVSTESTPQKKNKYKISTKSDVWSLGCIFYLCVYRRTPFSNIKNFYAKYSAITSTETKINYPPTPMYYPPMLLEIIQKCLQFDPKARSKVAELLKYPFNLIDESILPG